MKIILYQPKIPQNAGNIVRTCAVTGSDLIMVKPLGFHTNNRLLKRAGLDYWEGVNVSFIDNLEEYLTQQNAPFYFFSSKASNVYSSVKYASNSVLIFGSETDGLPVEILTKWSMQCLKLPMLVGARCLNLATTVGIVIYEAWRQQQFT